MNVAGTGDLVFTHVAPQEAPRDGVGPSLRTVFTKSGQLIEATIRIDVVGLGTRKVTFSQ
jgi:hypothetical protein